MSLIPPMETFFTKRLPVNPKYAAIRGIPIGIYNGTNSAKLPGAFLPHANGVMLPESVTKTLNELRSQASSLEPEITNRLEKLAGNNKE